MAEPAIAATVRALIADARAAWPAINLDETRFAAHVATLHGDPTALDRVRGADLWLAFACASGDATALRILEQQYLPKAARAIARFGDPHGFVEDAIQLLRERLLVGDPPRIATYAGAGSLESWLKVAAVRVAINLRAKQDHPVEPDDRADAALAGVQDPELDFIKAQYRGDFASALRDSFADLDADERGMLRFYLIDKLNIAEIAGLFGVSRATIGRRIVDAREKILAGTRDRLKSRLQIASEDLDSLLALVQSQVDLSLSQVLGTSA
jgi:RNA polymerase sigma-70 factor (ECF subfamily)